MPNSAMKIICIKLYEIEDIPEKPLSESKNYTLVCIFFRLVPFPFSFSKRREVGTVIRKSRSGSTSLLRLR